MAQYSFGIDNVHCPSCERVVRGVIAEQDPQARVRLLQDREIVSINSAKDIDLPRTLGELYEHGFDVHAGRGQVAYVSAPAPADAAHWPRRWLGRLRALVGLPAVPQHKRERNHAEICEECTVDAGAGAAAPPGEPTDQLDAFRAVFSIAGMTCASCSQSIVTAVKMSLPEVLDVSAEPLSGAAYVLVPARDMIGAAQQAIEDAGFSATLTEVLPISATHVKEYRVVAAIRGMTCSSCSSSVKATLEALPAVTRASVEVLSGQAEIFTKERPDLAAIQAAVEDVGYDITFIGEPAETHSAQAQQRARTVTLKVSGIYCDRCPSQVMDALKGWGDAVDILDAVSVAQPFVKFTYLPAAPQFTLRKILARLEEANPELHFDVVRQKSLEELAAENQLREKAAITSRLTLTSLIAVPTAVLMFSDAAMMNYRLMFVLASPVYFGAADIFHRKALKEVRMLLFHRRPAGARAGDDSLARRLWRRLFHFGSMNLLMSLGTSISYWASILIVLTEGDAHEETYFDSVIFLTFFLLVGRYLDIYSKIKTTSAVSLIAEVRPDVVELVDEIGMSATTQSGSTQPRSSEASAAQSDANSSTHPGSDTNSPTHPGSDTNSSTHSRSDTNSPTHPRSDTNWPTNSAASPSTTSSSTASPTNPGSTSLGGSGLHTRPVNIDLVEVGDTVAVFAGQRCAVDGVVLSSGTTEFNESMLTGESLPVPKTTGDEVFAGTLNSGRQSVLLKVTAVGKGTLLNDIVDAVRDGQMQRAPIETFVEQLTAVFVPLVVYLALAVWLVWYLATGQARWSMQFAIATFVVACPCGIGLAAPTALYIGSGLAAKYGILARGGGEAFQEGANIDVICFDKTGTITVGGDLRITDTSGAESDEAVQLAARLESDSVHPLAAAIIEYAKGRTLTEVRCDRTEQIEHQGRGIKAKVMVGQYAGQVAVLGNERVIHEVAHCQPSNEQAKLLKQWKSEGKSVVLLAIQGQQIILMFAFADQIRPESRKVIHHLQTTLHIQCWMISGDNEETAKAVGRKVGIPESQIIAGVLPQQKADKVRDLQMTGATSKSQYGRAIVAMVGDGINDAPALATSDVGVALGRGADIALSSSQFVLLREDLRGLPILCEISQAVMFKIKTNFFWAGFYNVVAIPLAAGVFYPWWQARLDPVWASLAMALSSVSVMTSSLLLRRFRPKGNL